ncbi:MAG: SMC family ATPase [Caldisericia bacterium]|nr:SMC family ATPase [Caldisericia bacterium]
MIPICIKLQNFLSYREETTIDFSSFHVAVITGLNGAGKSSILDAITYSLFGVARGTSKSGDNADRLIFSGESFCKVELDFEMNDQLYKVIRKRDKKQELTELELYINLDDKWVSIMGSTNKLTQEKINSIIKVNYELFASSVFIMQGKADAFTQKDPSERKMLLSEILQLDIYEKLRDKTQERKKIVQKEMDLLRHFIDVNQEKLSQKSNIENDLQILQNQIKEYDKDLAELNSITKSKRDKIKKMEIALEKKRNLLERLERENTNIASLTSEKQEYLKQIDEAQKIIIMQHEIETGYQRLMAYFNKDKKMNEDFETRTRIEKRVVEIKEKIAEEEHKLKLQKVELEKEESIYLSERSNLLEINLNIQKLQNEQKELERTKFLKDEAEKVKTETQIEKATLENKVNEMRLNLVAVKSKKEELSKKIYYLEGIIRDETIIDAQLKKIKESKARLEILNDEMRKEMSKIDIYQNQIDETKKIITDLDEKLAILLKENSTKRCPLCGTPLTLSRESELVLNYKRELDQKKESIQLNLEKSHEVKLQIENLGKKKKQMEEDALLENEFTEKKTVLLSAKAQIRSLNEEIYSIKVNESQLISEIQRVNEKIDYLKTQIRTLDKKYTDYCLRVSTEANVLRSLGELHAQLGKAIEAEQKLPLISAALIKINRTLETKKYCSEMRIKLEELEKDLFDITYDPVLHKEIKRNIENFQYFESEKKLLSEKINQKQLLTSAINKINEKIINSNQEGTRLQEELNQISVDVEEVAKVQESITNTNAIIETKKEEREQLVIQHAKLNQNLVNVNALDVELAQKVKENESLLYEEKLLQKSGEIFSKNGIPAFIIENALPEIEIRANSILDIISDGKLQVFFKVFSITKKGQFRETLDIEISNEGNIRTYELFSGGEKFKVDIAIRIAISHILANHSGFELSVLFIDEGFGTQDGESVLRFVECINRIRDDFRKIIVITHMDELKDYFESNVHVVKINDVSRLAVH